jgi:DNA-directed RNA polymerase subunit RPC12/RpoP
MLSMFDDIADMDLKLTLSEQDGSNPVTIESLNIPNAKLSSFYNALGSFLHLPQPMKVRDYKLKISKIKEIFSALEKIASGPLIIQKIEYKSFECERCHKPIIYTEHFIENQESISCQNINCGLNYAIKYLGTEVLFGANSLFPCSDCGTEVSVATQDIKEGTESECPGCKAVYRFYLNLSPIPKAEAQ